MIRAYAHQTGMPITQRAGVVGFCGAHDPDPMDITGQDRLEINGCDLWPKRQNEVIPAVPGNAEAVEFYNRGMDYAYGFKVKADAHQAGENFFMAAYRGDGKVKLLVGKIYAGGLGVLQPNEQKAREYLDQAFYHGDEEVKLEVALAFAKGVGDHFMPNESKAKRYLDMTAVIHHLNPIIRRRIGAYYKNGVGVVKPSFWRGTFISQCGNRKLLEKVLNPYKRRR